MLKRLLYGMGDALFPAKCLGCGRLFQHDTATPPTAYPAGFSAAMAPYFCLRCRDRWTAVASPLCSRCGLVFKSREGEDHLCGRCLDRPGVFTRARAAGIYDNTLKTAIHALKFKGKVSLAGPLGRLLLDTFRSLLDGRRHRCGGTGSPSPATIPPAGIQPGLPAGETVGAARRDRRGS